MFTARDFIKPNENLLVIFTHGMHFELNDDNTGSTGEWNINVNRSVDQVLIYHRNDELKVNTLYIANHDGVQPSKRTGMSLQVGQCLFGTFPKSEPASIKEHHY